jgi:hypothetical protein
MIRNFYNADIDVTVIIDYTGPMHTTGIMGDETKVTDEEILALYNDNKLEGWKRVA